LWYGVFEAIFQQGGFKVAMLSGESIIINQGYVEVFPGGNIVLNGDNNVLPEEVR